MASENNGELTAERSVSGESRVREGECFFFLLLILGICLVGRVESIWKIRFSLVRS